ncbi:hypothetical protein MHLP_03875 [Candidatus Mycoplasma haematolamae str. Purdue]|uniref:Uncharacterized protein n=1 Tax=Mycoplasma haematolamae (strain Purdue) TaxID=1212765 RepID=I7BAL0_MYCHA|nr:hypothetical protein [Candidatus Mycoplasma haematolamae]AFO52355.1 hypothetical protein MHLP_03875 [Candidatus Mycoplasma haematolamae str. Purdue]
MTILAKTAFTFLGISLPVGGGTTMYLANNHSRQQEERLKAQIEAVEQQRLQDSDVGVNLNGDEAEFDESEDRSGIPSSEEECEEAFFSSL